MFLHQDLFVIPQTNGLNIIYAPTRKHAFFANNAATTLVQKYIDRVPFTPKEQERSVVQYLLQLEEIPPNAPTANRLATGQNLVIILSQICNLACSYCFAQEARAQEVLDQDRLQAAIDTVFANAATDAPHNFSFIGGGEPTLTWQLFKWAVTYINAHKNEKRVKISLTTNGTLLTESKVKFLKENGVAVGLSFDILPVIQDTQRPFYQSINSSFEIVDAGIALLTQYSIPLAFRSTITKKYVTEMEAMVRFVHNRYQNIKRLHFEAVSDPTTNDALYYQDFCKYFFRARELGTSFGIKVFNSITHSVDRIRGQFCHGEFCIVPTGEIFSCHRVSSLKEKWGKLFFRGSLEEVTALQAKQEEKNIFLTTDAKCETCFAKWHCAGGCLYDKLTLSPEQLACKCQLVRDLIVGILRERLLKQ